MRSFSDDEEFSFLIKEGMFVIEPVIVIDPGKEPVIEGARELERELERDRFTSKPARSYTDGRPCANGGNAWSKFLMLFAGDEGCSRSIF